MTSEEIRSHARLRRELTLTDETDFFARAAVGENREEAQSIP